VAVRASSPEEASQGAQTPWEQGLAHRPAEVVVKLILGIAVEVLCADFGFGQSHACFFAPGEKFPVKFFVRSFK